MYAVLGSLVESVDHCWVLEGVHLEDDTSTLALVGKFDFTVDESLVRMAMLTEKKNRLSRMKGVRELVRNSVYRSEPEFTKRNYDATLVEAEYRKTSDELVRLQMALDKANMSIEFDVDI